MNSLNIDNCYGHYLTNDLSQFGKIIAEYIWVDGSGNNVRSKARTLNSKISSVEEIPDWNYDGSSTEQAPSGNSEVILKPVNYYPDPFRGGDNILVLCETLRYDLKTGDLFPTNTNFRYFSSRIFKSVEDCKPFTEICQFCTFYEKITPFSKQQLGWPEGGYPAADNSSYCGVGTSKSHGRIIMDAFMNYCAYSGVKLSNTNSGKLPGEWEFEVGP